MILVTGTITFDADKTDTLLSAVADLVPATLAEEGCVDYGFWLSPTEPGVVRVVEQWADEAQRPFRHDAHGDVHGCHGRLRHLGDRHLASRCGAIIEADVAGEGAACLGH